MSSHTTMRVLFAYKSTLPKSTRIKQYSIEQFCRIMLEKYSDGTTAQVWSFTGSDALESHLAANDIDIVIIEGNWLACRDLEHLATRFSKIKFIVRYHSNFPFLVEEHNISSTVHRVSHPDGPANLQLAFNLLSTVRTVQVMYRTTKVIHLPNWYHLRQQPEFCPNDRTLSVGMFGMNRVLKNLYTGAVAVRTASTMIGLPVRLHLNRSHMNPHILQNIRELYGSDPSLLDETDHQPMPQFQTRCVQGRTLGLVPSFTETFCNVAADHIQYGQPVLHTGAVGFIENSRGQVQSTHDTFELAELVREFISDRDLRAATWAEQYAMLLDHNNRSVRTWLDCISSI